jgi:hypothetical protein
MPVVVFDRDRGLQAEGAVTGYAATNKAGNGVQRYSVGIRDLTLQQYTHLPKVNRFGVAIYYAGRPVSPLREVGHDALHTLQTPAGSGLRET